MRRSVPDGSRFRAKQPVGRYIVDSLRLDVRHLLSRGLGSVRGSGAVSPTAHYTGQTWVGNGLSHPELATWQGRALHGALALPIAGSRALGGPTLDGPLLARHRIIDALLADHVRDGVRQVVEIACGMSPRGWRFSERFDDRLTYVEADLPAMAQRKREALGRIGSSSPRHRVVELDILREGGPDSLESLIETLDPAHGLAIVTEGLLPYFDDATVDRLWARLATALARFPRGVYLADVRLAETDHGIPERAFMMLLSAFVRGRVHAYRGDGEAVEVALRRAGFAQAVLHRGDEHPAAVEVHRDAGARLISVIEARAS
jgi:O-methyltransferase involved in polyketide biosynthesis